MLYSKLVNENFYYVNLHAEEALDFLDEFQNLEYDQHENNKKIGIYVTEVNAVVFNTIMTDVDIDKDLVLDCKHVFCIDTNSMIYLIKLIRKYNEVEKSVHFINVEEALYEGMMEQFKNEGMYIRDEKGFINVLPSEGIENTDEEFYIKQVKDTYTKMIRELLKDCVVPKTNKVHSSTTVYLDKYINIKKIFSVRKESFLCFCIYMLAVNLVETGIISWNYTDNIKHKIFFHTLNGSYIGGILAALLQMDFVYLDHLGPVNAIRKKNFEKAINSEDTYIVVSDVICTSSEIGRAETIILYNGGHIVGRVCFADIETVRNKNQKQVSCITVSAEDNFIDYSIRTELCKSCKEGNKKCRKKRK